MAAIIRGNVHRMAMGTAAVRVPQMRPQQKRCQRRSRTPETSEYSIVSFIGSGGLYVCCRTPFYIRTRYLDHVTGYQPIREQYSHTTTNMIGRVSVYQHQKEISKLLPIYALVQHWFRF
eukprot:sb/3476260/